ncbi:MAG TPA: phospholipase C, phosphocholine-specific [Cyclobacteriaceae bacterium]|nr:phospholipase C, phosphocholine-specific [Cyclobacteriaceae bacterium]
MDSRRDFLKKAALLTGAGISNMFPPSIQRALAINPELGSTFLDAEHVVILMQENRSFDHCYGALRGVRGFNDPRAIRLANKNPVWYQTNADGETYAPFRLNIKDTKATWMGSLPHGWTDQVDARNEGKYDQWLIAKKPGRKEYSKMPLALGYYNREDIPFYYSLADAFTVCDQNFCSSLTGTTPNRLYLWTGTIREEPTSKVQARVRNSELDYDVPGRWKTFPERLEENNISWKIYQNEISADLGFEGEEDAWLANFTDNPIEWFSQYNVRFHPPYIKFLPKKIELIKEEIKKLQKELNSASSPGEDFMKLSAHLEKAKAWLEISLEEQQRYTADNFSKLSSFEKNIHQKAFTTNVNDPYYHELTTLKYKEGNEEREVKVPRGDVMFQFREDVKNGKLPTVSWLVAPENFSDHPGAPWYGAWYVSEALDILTQNPEVWKKTIFILCYDENDGYFDHVPPFVPPNPYKEESGLVSDGIDTTVEWVALEQDLQRRPPAEARGSSIGLGYRVPLVVASPWSRGGFVNSQVFDHTSILQFLEKFLTHKTGKDIEEANISTWRRTVCGDLTSTFRPYHGEKFTLPTFLEKDEVIEGIHKAKFKDNPSAFKPLSKDEIEKARNGSSTQLTSRQEKGTRPSNPLPYQLYAEGKLGDDRKSFMLSLEASDTIFANKAAGSPFHVYSNNNKDPRAYAVKAGDRLTDSWKLSEFENNRYAIQVHGPNGFFREFSGNENDPDLDVACNYEIKNQSLTGNVALTFTNKSNQARRITIMDRSYQHNNHQRSIKAGGKAIVPLNLKESHGWYDFMVTVEGNDSFKKCYAGRVENGKETMTDPAMGN